MVEKEWESSGLKCRVVLQERGVEKVGSFRCGYVRVGESHSLFRKSFSYENLGYFSRLDVHGGVTYAGEADGGGWWFGFDCAHLGDSYHPDLYKNAPFTTGLDPDGHFWSTKEVAKETEKLAKQLSEYREES